MPEQRMQMKTPVDTLHQRGLLAPQSAHARLYGSAISRASASRWRLFSALLTPLVSPAPRAGGARRGGALGGGASPPPPPLAVVRFSVNVPPPVEALRSRRKTNADCRRLVTPLLQDTVAHHDGKRVPDLR